MSSPGDDSPCRGFVFLAIPPCVNLLMPLLHTWWPCCLQDGFMCLWFDFFPGRLNRALCQYGEGKRPPADLFSLLFTRKSDAWNDCSIAFGPWCWHKSGSSRSASNCFAPKYRTHTHTCMHVWLKASFHWGDWPNAISLSVDYHVIYSSSVAQSTRDRDYYAPVSPCMRGVHRSFTILYGLASYSGVC